MKRALLSSLLLLPALTLGAGAAISACVGSDPVVAADAGAPVDATPPPIDASADTSLPPPPGDATPPPVDAADAANPCPYSRLGTNGRCEPVCGVRFTLGADVAPGPAVSPTVVSVDGEGEGSYGLANDGSFLFYAPARASGAGSGYAFARKTSSGYSVVDLPAASMVNVETGRGGHLTSDGLHVVFVTAKNALLWGDADLTTGAVTFSPTGGPFSTLNPLLPPPSDSQISSPALSGDGLTLTFSRNSQNAGVAGTYQSRRASVTSPFPQAKRLEGDLSNFTRYQAISALSYDGLTAFVFDAFTTRIFTRGDVGDEFTTDLTRAAIPAWQMGVANRCDTLVATRSIGGAQNQQIVTITATP